MKKNLISVAILALVMGNLILTAVLMITVVPQAQKANDLISKVGAAIDLEVNGQGSNVAAGNGPSVPMDQIEEYAVNGGKNMTFNLKNDGSGQQHYASVAVTLGINTKAKDYKTYGAPEKMAAKDGMIQDVISDAITSHTMQEVQSDQKEIKLEILTGLQGMYGSDFIVNVSMSVTAQ